MDLEGFPLFPSALFSKAWQEFSNALQKSALSMGEWSVFLQPIKVRSASEGEPCLYIPGLAVFQNASKQTNKQEGETCYLVGEKETMFLHVVTDLVTQAPRDSRCCLRNWEHADYVSGYTSIVRPWMLAYEMETTVRTSTMPSKHWCRMRSRKGRAALTHSHQLEREFFIAILSFLSLWETGTGHPARTEPKGAHMPCVKYAENLHRVTNVLLCAFCHL